MEQNKELYEKFKSQSESTFDEYDIKGMDENLKKELIKKITQKAEIESGVPEDETRLKLNIQIEYLKYMKSHYKESKQKFTEIEKVFDAFTPQLSQMRVNLAQKGIFTSDYALDLGIVEKELTKEIKNDKIKRGKKYRRKKYGISYL